MTRLRPVLAFVRTYGTGIWLALVVPLAVWFCYRQRADLSRTWDLLLGAQPAWIMSVFFLEIIGFVLMAAVYGIVLRCLGHAITLRSMVGLHLQRVVVGAVTPMGGPSSLAVFVHRLRQRGIHPCDSILATSIKSVSGHVAFLMILLPALFVRKPTTLMLGSTICVTIMVTVMVFLLGLALRERKPPIWLIHRIPRRGLRLVAQLRNHQFDFRVLLLPFSYLIVIKATGVLALFFCLQAVGYNGSFEVPLTAYVVGVIFTVLAPIFSGIGLVEVGMAVALQRLGVPAPAAVGATLLSRMMGMWVPLGIGLLVQVAAPVLIRLRPQANPLPAA
jgi:uncharacterized protein (TIRG00374 family)